MSGDAIRGRQYAESGERGDSANQVNVQESNQVKFGAFRGSFSGTPPWNRKSIGAWQTAQVVSTRASVSRAAAMPSAS
jgi:hypothetical protein